MDTFDSHVKEVRKAYREMIVDEEVLIHRRLTWLITIQIAFLGAVIGGSLFLLDGGKGISSEDKNLICNFSREITPLLAKQGNISNTTCDFVGKLSEKGHLLGKNENVEFALIVLSIIGFIDALLIFSALIASTRAMKIIQKKWQKVVLREKYQGPDIFGLPPDFNKAGGILPYFSSENMLAISFLGMWVSIIIWQLPISGKIISGFVAYLVGIPILFFWIFIHNKEEKEKE